MTIAKQQQTNNSHAHHRPPGMGGGGFRRRQHMLAAPQKAHNTKGTLKKLWFYLQGHSKTLATVFFLVLVSTILNLIGPYLIGLAIDSMGIGPGVVNFKLLIEILAILAVVYLLGPLMSWLQSIIMVALSHQTVQDLRQDLFSHLQTLSIRFFDTNSRGDIMSRLTNDMDNISNTLSQGVTQIMASLITVLGALIMMIVISPLLTLISLIVVPLGVVATQKTAGRTRHYFLNQQNQLGALNGYIEEIISGQKVVQAYAQEQKVMQNFNQQNNSLKQYGIKAQIFAGIIFPMMNFINNISFALVAGCGGYLAVKGTISVGMIAAFLNYSKQLARPINELANQFNLLQAALAGAERIFEVLDEKPETIDDKHHPHPTTTSHPPTLQKLTDVAGEVIFGDVTFGYHKDQPVLKNISLKASPGQTVALVGPTGSGKTTIVNLLLRFYDPDSGAVFIDGQDITTVTRESLRAALGIVLQDTYLFSGSVLENIRYGKLDATTAQVQAAARLANAESFILRLPQGYDTLLTEDGGNLSVGQCQLLAIARAVLADPAILILDEATSSVDTRTEMQIQQAMLSLMQGRTSFVIAHRLSTILGADQILFIKDGQIVEQGTHEQLLAKQGFYHGLYNSQTGQSAFLTET